MEINRLKVQIVVSIQLQRTLHDPSQGINVLSSELISNFLIYMYIYTHTHTQVHLNKLESRGKVHLFQ